MDSTAEQLQRACATWYAFGYNDHRTAGQPMVDAFAFAEAWVELQSLDSRPSLQEAFNLFLEAMAL